MSDEMVGDNASKEKHTLNSDVTPNEDREGIDDAVSSGTSADVSAPEVESTTSAGGAATETEAINEPEITIKKEIDIKEEVIEEETEVEALKVGGNKSLKRRASEAFSDGPDEEFKGFDVSEISDTGDLSLQYSCVMVDERRIKRRTSISNNEGFKGFDLIKHNNLTGYYQVLERLEAEVAAAVKSFTPLRKVTALLRASKRARQDTGGCTKWSDHLEAEVTDCVRSFSDEDVKPAKRPRRPTDGSRPSSALSSRSEGDGGITDSSSSPAARGRRATAEMSSPLLRVPLDRGWKRELVYRASGTTSDSQNRRNADIYYYTPSGKKLRSTREVSEQLSGTGLTLENFSFFKEPLGVDDPEKEIIRDAKIMRRVESPVPPAPPPVVLDSKRTPKPKAPKGASPEPATLKSPPAKIKVKSVGSRLSSNGTTPTPKPKKPPAQTPTPQPQPPLSDNNNTAAWKKPRGPPPLQPRPPAPLLAPPHAPHTQLTQVPRQTQQPCSMTCGRAAGEVPAVPSLACDACLCLYHPVCVGITGAPPEKFLCKNCRKPCSSPPLDPPPLMHKSGVASTAAHQMSNTPPTSANIGNQGARRMPMPVPVPVPVPAKVPRNDKRVLLRMKVAGGGPDGERVWAVAKPATAPATPPPPAAAPATPIPSPAPVPAPPAAAPVPAPACRPTLPQSLAVLNGRRFIVVSRALHHDSKPIRGRALANGAASPPAVQSPRRRGRGRVEDLDHFTAFCNHENGGKVAVQIFQYLGMRDLARCARVCKLWQQLAATPSLWRHVRMKNSHVSDWAGLCAALKRHGTRWLDLRKMLLPPNDAVFWDQFTEHIGSVDTLDRLELCRCPARAVEAACAALPGLRTLNAPAIRDARLDPAPLALLPRLEMLRLKSLAGLSLTRDLKPLAALSRLQHLSLTSIKDLGWCACEVVGQLEHLESLELGECSFGASFGSALGKLSRLRRLRLERGVAHCQAPQLLSALAALPNLTSLELVNFDVKVGFDDALAECKNIQRLLIIPTYVSQSATTNKQVLSGVLRLKDTLTHLMWGVTIELLRVTELFIDQCEAGEAGEAGEGEGKRRDVGECIPVLKPVPGCRLPDDHRTVAGPPQVEILPIPTLQRLLSAQLPNTKLKLLRIPFHATWRQSLADFQ